MTWIGKLYPLHVVAHPCIKLAGAVIKGSFFSDQQNNCCQLLLGVEAESIHAPHQRLKLDRSQFVQDASKSLKHLMVSCLGHESATIFSLKPQKTNKGHILFNIFKIKLPP